MKLNKLWLIVVMFAVLAVPAFAAVTDATQSLPYDSDYTDNSGNANDGTNSGTTIDTSFKLIGAGSVEHDSLTDNVDLGKPYTSGSDDFSMSFWINLDQWNANERIITADKNLGGTNNKMQLYYSAVTGRIGELRANFKDTSATVIYTTGVTMSTGSWHHIVYTRSAGTYKVYVNGTLVDTVTGGRTGDVLGTAGFRQGANTLTPTNGFDGHLDQFLFYTQELNATEVSELYNSGAGLDPFTSTDTSFNITAADAETAAPINTFNVTLNSTKLTTTNGTITYNVTGEYTTLIEAEGYQPVTTTYTYDAGTSVQWNLTKIDRNVTFQAFNNFSSPLNDFNLSIDGVPYTTSTGTIIAELDRTVLHNLTFTAEGYYPNVTLNFNATNDYNATLTTVFTNTTFTAVDDNATALSKFNVTILGVTTNIDNTSGVIELDTRNLYNITFTKEGYIGQTLLNQNISSAVQGTLTSYFQITVGTPTGGAVTGTLAEANQSLPYDSDYTDNSGNGNDGTNGGTTIDTSFKLIGAGSVEHDATTDYVDLGKPYASGSDDFTISFWLNLDQWGPGRAIMSTNKNLGGTNNKMQVYYSNVVGRVNELRANFKDISQTVIYTTGVNLTVDSWHHIVYTREAGTYKVYVNGTLVDTVTGGRTGDVLGTEGLHQGYNDISATGGFDGHLDQFLFYDQALNATLVSELWNSGNGLDPFTGGTGGNLTGDYNVLWNGSLYYPNDENITFLPVRNTIENFSLNPIVPQYKGLSVTNWNTSTHYNLDSFNLSHRVDATNRYDNSTLYNFTVSTPVQNYTASGQYAYLQNDTGIINYTVSLANYFDVTNENVDVTNGTSSVLMHQAEVRFNGTQRFTNNNVAQGNVTIGSTKKAFGETFYLNAGTYTVLYDSVFDEAVPQNFTLASLSNATETVVNITNANLSITGINAVDGSPIPFFTTTIVNNTLFINLSKTEASPHLYNLIQNISYNVTFDNSTFALNDTLITLDNRTNSYVFYVYTTNSFNITILDEINQSEITGTNFTVEFIGSYESYNTTYTEGNLYIDLIVPDEYQIRYNWNNESGATDYGMLRQYYYLLTNRTHNPLDLYAIENSASDEIEVTVQNADTLQREEGVIVLLQRFYIDSNSYETVAMYRTDSQGKAFFDVEKYDELYRFSLQDPLGTTVRTTEPAYLQEDSYIIYTVSTVENFETAIDLGEINASFDWDNTSQTLTVAYSDPAQLYSEYTLNLYEKGTYSNTLINSSSATSGTGSLVVSYAFANDTQYIGTLSVSNSPSIEIARFSITDFIETQPLPNLSLFLVSILFSIMVFVSAFSLYSVVIGAVALVAAQLMGLLTFSTPVVGMILFGAIFLAVILEWRRG